MIRCLLAALAVILFGAGDGAAFAPAKSASFSALRDEAARNPAAQSYGDRAKRDSGASFDGMGSIQVLKPVDYVAVPGSDFSGPPRQETPLAPVPEAADGNSGPVPIGDSYHFEGRRTAIPNLTIYTPVKDAPGQDNGTEAPKESGFRKWLPTALAVGGAAATIGGLFFPPLLFLGGLLLGGFLMWKLMGG